MDWCGCDGRSFDASIAVSCAGEDMGVAGCGCARQQGAAAETFAGQQGSQCPAGMFVIEWLGVGAQVANGNATIRMANRHRSDTMRCNVVMGCKAML